MNQVSRFFTLVSDRLTTLGLYLNRLSGTTGHVIKKQQSSATMSVEPIGIINQSVAIVESDDEAEVAKGSAESFANVFNNWTRFSHDGRFTFPARPNEVDAWRYNEEDDQIECTINSRSLIGFVAPDAHDHYTFEVTLRSTNSDDDSIGVCLAFTRIGTREHAIVAMRTPGGSQNHGGPSTNHTAKLLDVYSDIFNSALRLDLGSTNGGLEWGDGIVDDDRVLSSDLGGGGWSNHPGGCRLRVTRTGNHFKVETTNLDSEVYVPSATVEFTLDDHPSLAKFKGPQRYGYVCYSQNASTWETHIRPIETSVIYDFNKRSLEVYEAGSWVTYPYAYLNQYVDGGVFYYNQSSDRLYWAETNGDISRIPLESQ